MTDQVKFYENKLAFEIDAFDLFKAVRSGEDIVIVDARDDDAYEMEHIPTSINMPHIDINSDNTNDFSKEALYVTYCDGNGCNASTKAALKFASLGFKVKELQGGLDWWVKDGYSTEGARLEEGGGCCGSGGCGCS